MPRLRHAAERAKNLQTCRWRVVALRLLTFFFSSLTTAAVRALPMLQLSDCLYQILFSSSVFLSFFLSSFSFPAF